MNMILLTGLSVALTLSIMTVDNFYANKVTNTSIKDANRQIEMTMSNVFRRELDRFTNWERFTSEGGDSGSRWSNTGPN